MGRPLLFVASGLIIVTHESHQVDEAGEDADGNDQWTATLIVRLCE